MDAYTIHRDGPGYLVKRYLLADGSGVHAATVRAAGSLEEARRAIPAGAGLECKPRLPSDDPTLVETWI